MNNFLFFYAGSLFYFFADVLQKKTSGQTSTWAYVFKRSVFTASIAWLLAILIAEHRLFPHWKELLLFMGTSIFSCLGFFYYIKAINYTNFSNVGSLSIVGTAIQLTIGFLVFQEPFNWMWLPPILLLCTGSVLQLLQKKTLVGARFVLFSVLSWSIANALLSRVLKNVDVIWSVPLMETALLLMSGFVLFSRKRSYNSNVLLNPSTSIRMSLIGLFIFGGSYCSFLSLQSLPISVLSILQLSMLPIVYLLSLKIFKERPSAIEFISFITGCIGFAWYLMLK